MSASKQIQGVFSLSQDTRSRCTFGFDSQERNEDHQDLSWQSAYPVAE